MADPKGVSIVIPNFNYERYVGASIESALNQTYGNIEVIVVDDGSTDGSRGIIDRYGDALCVIFQQNQGNLRARMAGYAACNNEIIFFLDSDDMLDPRAVSKVVDKWITNVSKVQFALTTIDEHGESLGNVYPKYPSDISSRSVTDNLLTTGSYPSPPTSGNAYSRRFIDELLPILNNAPPLAAIDTIANTLAPLHGRVETINEPLAFYRVHDSNISCQTKIDRQRFLRFARQEEIRISILTTHAEGLGVKFDANVLERNMAYQHARLAAEKLKTESNDMDFRTTMKLTRNAVRSTLKSGFGFWPKILLAGWIGMVGLSPKQTARGLLAQRYAAQQRNRWIKTISELFSQQPRMSQQL